MLVSLICLGFLTTQCLSIGEIESLELIDEFDLDGGLPESAVYDAVNDQYLIGRILTGEVIVQNPNTLEYVLGLQLSLVTPTAMVVVPQTFTLYINSPLTSTIRAYNLVSRQESASFAVPPDPNLGPHFPNGLCYDPDRNYLCYTDFGIDPNTFQFNGNGLLACLNLNTNEFFDLLTPTTLNGDNPNGCDIKNGQLYLTLSDSSLGVTSIIICNLDSLQCESDPDWLSFTTQQKTNGDNRFEVAESIQFTDDCNALIGTSNGSNSDEIGVITSYNICFDNSNNSNDNTQRFSNGNYKTLAENIHKGGDIGFDFNRDVVIVPEQNSGTFKLFQLKRTGDDSGSD